MDDELIRRAEDLDRQCARTGSLCATGFLTPAERYALSRWAQRGAQSRLLFHGGAQGAERQAAFFLPDWMEDDAFDPAEHLRAIEAVARFGAPGHRDWLGAVLALGIGREWLGDILTDGERAWLICLPSVEQHLLMNLDKVGRWGVRCRAVPLSELPEIARETETLRFTVSSPRLDAVCAGAFHVSRSAAAEAIAQGLVSRNYETALKPDVLLKAGDVLSLRGKGKCVLRSVGDTQTRKGRIYVEVGIYK